MKKIMLATVILMLLCGCEEEYQCDHRHHRSDDYNQPCQCGHHENYNTHGEHNRW